jgi:predicted  nucleic acid-binding Zn-ribbon protein
MPTSKITTQKEAFLKELEATDAEIVKLRSTIENLGVKGHQLRGAIYALDLALNAVNPPAQPEELPLEKAIAEANAAVEASQEA